MLIGGALGRDSNVQRVTKVPELARHQNTWNTLALGYGVSSVETRHALAAGTFADKKIDGLSDCGWQVLWWGSCGLPLIGRSIHEPPTRPKPASSSPEPAFRAVSRPGMNDACQRVWGDGSSRTGVVTTSTSSQPQRLCETGYLAGAVNDLGCSEHNHAPTIAITESSRP
jgi:hypothetical protein